MEIEISAKELSEKIKGNSVFIVDVRTPEEFMFCSLGGTNIPLSDLPHHWEEIPKDKEIVTVCHHGVRSLRAAFFLIEKGFEKVRSLRGGIDLWSVQIDPKTPRY